MRVYVYMCICVYVYNIMCICFNYSIYCHIVLHYAVPENSPTDVIVQPFSVSSVLISWESPFIPNGHITQYSLYVDFANGSQLAVIPVGGDQTQLEIVGLSPYQLVSVQVAAGTAVGEGPRSAQVKGRSSEEGENTWRYKSAIIVHIPSCTPAFRFQQYHPICL